LRYYLSIYIEGAEETQVTSIKITGVLTEIRAEHLSNMTQSVTDINTLLFGDPILCSGSVMDRKFAIEFLNGSFN
jgi:hypothetical protein